MYERRARVVGLMLTACFVGGWALTKVAGPAPQLDAGEIVGVWLRGDGDAIRQIRRMGSEDLAELRPFLAELLATEEPAARAAACQIIARIGDATSLPHLLARTADSDWRVRSAAYGAMGRVLEASPAALTRDTPLEMRERRILNWLGGTNPSVAEQVWLDLCEVFADVRHVEIGRELSRRCLECHAATPSRPALADADCATCHPGIVRQWRGSSHAQSLSHIRVKTVEPDTRKTQWLSFGSLEGIACFHCHEPISTRDDSNNASQCRYELSAAVRAADRCAQCHHREQQQFEVWRSAPRPYRVAWPPGQITTRKPPDSASCIDCHMAPDKQIGGARNHHLTARRDERLMRQGLVVAIQPVIRRNGNTAAAIILTNLAGHEYPTGTSRRALEVYIDFDAATPTTEPVAVYSPRPFAALDDSVDPALAPGERRQIDVSIPPGATNIYCRVVYRRNRFDPAAMRMEIAATSRRIEGR